MPRHIVLALTTVGLMLVLGAPASAQTQKGLVNIALTDTTVQLPVSVAANLCDIDVNVLAEDAADGDAACTATSQATAISMKPRDTKGAKQDGLVNVAVTDLTIQAPISVAANVCDVDVNVLARDLSDGDATCLAGSASRARA